LYAPWAAGVLAGGDSDVFEVKAADDATFENRTDTTMTTVTTSTTSTTIATTTTTTATIATTTTTTGAPNPNLVAHVGFVVHNLDFRQLINQVVVFGAFQAAVKQTIVSEAAAGASIDASQVSVKVSPGSVIVNSTITTTNASAVVAAITASQNNGVFTPKVENAIKGVAGIQLVSTGPISLGGVAISLANASTTTTNYPWQKVQPATDPVAIIVGFAGAILYYVMLYITYKVSPSKA